MQYENLDINKPQRGKETKGCKQDHHPKQPVFPAIKIHKRNEKNGSVKQRPKERHWNAGNNRIGARENRFAALQQRARNRSAKKMLGREVG